MRKLIFITLIAAWACNDIPECDLDPNLEYAVVEFYDIENKTAKEVYFNRITNNRSSVSIVDETESDTTAMAFGLDPASEDITYYLRTDSGTFSLKLGYEVNGIEFYSPDCDPHFAFSNLTASSSQFDSVVVVGSTIHKTITSNVEVYF